ncbi:MAG TPA: tetratricopeptide repeat protein [Verrucomicrobiae bacterium]|nr:tetratricopeptide repeat protein [Verrucomicrobiae bacterium]
MTHGQDIALWIIAICLIIQTVVSVRNMVSAKKSLTRFDDFRNKNNLQNNPERKAIQNAMATGQYNEALKIALNRQRTHPGDPYGWYDAGVCYYYMKDWDKARAQLLEAQRMCPTWEKEWTGPYLRTIEKQTGETKTI